MPRWYRLWSGLCKMCSGLGKTVQPRHHRPLSCIQFRLPRQLVSSTVTSLQLVSRCFGTWLSPLTAYPPPHRVPRSPRCSICPRECKRSFARPPLLIIRRRIHHLKKAASGGSWPVDSIVPPIPIHPLARWVGSAVNPLYACLRAFYCVVLHDHRSVSSSNPPTRPLDLRHHVRTLTVLIRFRHWPKESSPSSGQHVRPLFDHLLKPPRRIEKNWRSRARAPHEQNGFYAGVSTHCFHVHSHRGMYSGDFGIFSPPKTVCGE